MGAKMSAGQRIIMLLSNPFEPDVRVLKEARTLVGVGMQVTVLCWDRLGKFPTEEQGSINVRRLRIRSNYGGGVNLVWKFIRFNLALIARVLREEVDIIHCHDLDTLPAGFVAAKLKRKALVYDEHETEYFTQLPGLLRRTFEWIERFIARRADLVLVTNQLQVKKIQPMLPAGRSPVEIKNCPLSAFFHAPVPEEKSTVTLGWIGYLQRGTGMERLVRLFDRLGQRHPDLTLLLVGKVHPSFAQELARALAAARYRDRIERVEAVPYDEVYPWYRRLDIAVMLYEDMIQFRLNTPTKLFEAMAHGIPVVATAIGDVKEIVASHQCGFVVDCDDELEMEQRLETLIIDRALRWQLGKNGYEAAKRLYNWERMADRLIKSYEHLR